jgi:hypothetical protein
MVEPLLAGFAAENDGLGGAMAGAELRAGLAAMLELGQTREVELDLPGSIAARLPFAR